MSDISHQRAHPRPGIRWVAALSVLLVLALAGCSVPAVVIGGGATAGVAIAQERSVGDAIDDTVIMATINKLWFEAGWDLYSGLDVTVQEGRVLLTGKVKTPDDKLEAVRLAWQAKGVRKIINEIQVTDQSGIVDFTRDSWITAQLVTKLTFDENIRSINYSIETVNGVIYLMGIAQNQKELDRVTEYARNIRYVRSVVSHVLLKSDPKRHA